jgi:uncharacterized membrane protein YfcA
MFSGTLKDSITNVFALLMVIAGAYNAYIQANAGDINWFQLVVTIAVAVIGWFTGKDSQGKAKIQ